MIETENKNDDEEKDIEDMGNDQDDLEISNEEKPDISGLFVKPDNNNKELLNEEIKEVQKEQISNKNKEEIKVEESKDKQNGNGEKFYKVISQETTELKNNELNPVGFKYNIINTDNKKDESNNKDENKEKEEDDEEEEEDIENINKNIFN